MCRKPWSLVGLAILLLTLVPTSQAVVEMCRSLDVEMPIAEEVHLIVHKGKNIGDGVEALLSRSLKEE